VSSAPDMRALYDAFNRRDVEAVLEHMDPDVEWPNVMEGRTLHGTEAVREYWTKQFEVIDSTVTPRELDWDGERLLVRVHQRVRDARTGAELSDGEVVHVYEFRDGKIARMTVE
jgi:ketosteroid isomerase-like protein